MLIEDTIETPFGSTYVKRIGTGPLVFVIHGGPGMDHNYLSSDFDALVNKRTLIFYDQPGSGRSHSSPPLSPLELFQHFRWLSHHMSEEQPVGVIAHSWGALVLIGALLDQKLSTAPIANFQEGLLINPVPMCWEKFQICAKNNLGRMSLIDRLRLIWRTLFVADGAKSMALLLQYYVVNQQSLPAGEIAFNKKAYFTTVQQLKDFDYRPQLSQLPPLTAIMGAKDFITVDLIDDLTPHLRDLQVIPEVGHFPFWEAPSDFNKLLLNSFI